MRSREVPSAEVFWAKVDRSGGPDACWPWLKAISFWGYGVTAARRGAHQWKSHRLAYLLTHGALNDDLFVLHSCDNRRCCNPAHLREGTPADNARDMFLRGRDRVIGERNGRAILTASTVTEIRRRAAGGESNAALDAAYGLREGHALKIVTRRLWKCLAAALLLATPMPVQGQPSDDLLTARVCFSESPHNARECEQIVWATSERAVMHGRSYRSELQAYSPRATGRADYGDRAWIAALSPDALPDVGGVNRERLRWRFAVVHAAAYRALHGVNEPACRGLEWSATWCTRCRERMREAGYVRVACVGFSNAWWGPP